METQRRLVRLADGRDIEFLTAGPADGLPLVVHEGTPVGLVLNNRLAAAAAGRGLRVVQVARPGYEGSTPRPGRTVADFAPDVIAVLDEIGAAEFVSIGFSGGGPHTLACGALAPERCLGTASVAGAAPYQVEGLDFLAGMGPENVEEFSLAIRGADALTPFLEKEAAALRGITGDQIVASLGGLISGADAAVLTGEFAADLAKGVSRAVRNGIAGWRDDDLAFVADWGFPLDALRGRAAIWQGDQDNMVPFTHGQWLAAHVPGARVHLEPGAGHLTMTVTAIDRILDDLLDLAGRA
jgi:pimeloyl-ACP methyl ester carboxylesterase